MAKLLVDVDCDAMGHCGDCRHEEWNLEDRIQHCHLFNQNLLASDAKGIFRLSACLAAERAAKKGA